MLIDIHTHRLPDCPSSALWSGCLKDCGTPEFHRAEWISAGIHPWYLSADNLQKQLDWLTFLIASDRRVLAVGEAGLDKLCQTDFEVQMRAFRSVALLSEEYGLPLIIHSVKSFNEIVALKKEIRPLQPWIIHGFRGKEALAESLLRQGMYLSVGERFNVGAVKQIPSDRLLAETDVSHEDISAIVCRIAEAREETAGSLSVVLAANASRLFFKH